MLGILNFHFNVCHSGTSQVIYSGVVFGRFLCFGNCNAILELVGHAMALTLNLVNILCVIVLLFLPI